MGSAVLAGELLGGSGLVGWEYVEKAMERQVERGLTTIGAYVGFLEGHAGAPRTMDSHQHFLRWKRENPGKAVPRAVARIRNDREHAEWAAAGFPLEGQG